MAFGDSRRRQPRESAPRTDEAADRTAALEAHEFANHGLLSSLNVLMDPVVIARAMDDAGSVWNHSGLNVLRTIKDDNRNLYRFSQQAWENMNSLMKRYFFRRTKARGYACRRRKRGGGHGGGIGSNQLEG
jgi:hypothetical protein